MGSIDGKRRTNFEDEAPLELQIEGMSDKLSEVDELSDFGESPRQARETASLGATRGADGARVRATRFSGIDDKVIPPSSSSHSKSARSSVAKAARRSPSLRRADSPTSRHFASHRGTEGPAFPVASSGSVSPGTPLPRIIPPDEASASAAAELGEKITSPSTDGDKRESRMPLLGVPPGRGEEERGSISSESSLADKNKEYAKNAIRRGTLVTAEAAKKGYRRSKAFVIKEYVRFKNDPKRGPVLLLYLSVISCIFLIPALFIDLVTLALTLSVAEALADIYGIIGCFVILAAEFARKSSKLGIRGLLHYYFAFSEFCAGRGTIQLFVASLCISARNLLNLFKFIPGILILICGLLNVLYGLYAASKLNAMLAKMKNGFEAEDDEEGDDDENETGSSDDEEDGGDRDGTDGDAEAKGTDSKRPSATGDEKDSLLVTKKKSKKRRKSKRRDTDFESKTMTEKLDLLDRKFEALDKRGDGRLTKKDLKEGMKELNLDIGAVELDVVFRGLDKNEDGVVTKEEFEEWWFATKGPRFL